MNGFQLFLSQIYGVIKSFRISDLIDIALISYLIYKGIQLVRETRAGQLLKGLLLLLGAYCIAVWFRLTTMKFLLTNIFQIGIIALIILFQPEIRRALEKVGRTKVANLSRFSADAHGKEALIWENAIAKISDAAAELSKTKTGALIVIEQETKLGEQLATGVEVDAEISVELLLNIFYPNTPLHDGAVIVRDGKVHSAACFLPKPAKEEFIATNFGTRHRAAIGISEISDAITVVVSEETGVISVSEDGQLIRNFSRDSLCTYLTDKLMPIRTADANHKKKLLWRTKK